MPHWMAALRERGSRTRRIYLAQEQVSEPPFLGSLERGPLASDMVLLRNRPTAPRRTGCQATRAPAWAGGAPFCLPRILGNASRPWRRQSVRRTNRPAVPSYAKTFPTLRMRGYLKPAGRQAPGGDPSGQSWKEPQRGSSRSGSRSFSCNRDLSRSPAAASFSSCSNALSRHFALSAVADSRSAERTA